MIRSTQIRFNQTIELFKHEGFISLIKNSVFFKRKLIVFKKDLSAEDAQIKQVRRTNVNIINVTLDDFKTQDYQFSSKSRFYKAIKYFRYSSEAFFALKNNIVIGDVWFSSKSFDHGKDYHPDLAMLNFKLNKEDIYMFDMYLEPSERGSAVESSILGQAINTFQRRGFKNIFTYVMAENTPALWMTRVMGFKELNYLYMSRLFFIRKITV